MSGTQHTDRRTNNDTLDNIIIDDRDVAAFSAIDVVEPMKQQSLRYVLSFAFVVYYYLVVACLDSFWKLNIYVPVVLIQYMKREINACFDVVYAQFVNATNSTCCDV